MLRAGPARAGSLAEQAVGGGGDVVDLGQDRVLELGRVGDVALLGADPADRGVELPERLLGHPRRDLAAEAGRARRPRARPAAATSWRTDSATISWSQGTSVRRSTISIDAPSVSASRSAALRDRSTVAPHVTIVRSVAPRHVATPAERHDVVGAGERVAGVRLAQQVLVLEEQHRVLAPERRPQQAGGVARPRRDRR